jgi:hypothetical protein
MSSFRTVRSSANSALERGRVRALLEDAVASTHFYTANGARLQCEHVAAQEVPWEIFHGQLLDRAFTQQQQTFEAWNIYRIDDGQRSGEPLLSLKLDAEGGIHVTRAILCHAWEGYDAGNNVFLSRETTKWVRELVGAIDSRDFKNEDDLRDEVICRLFLAVVGVSRLPLISVEAPLPDFTLGRLAYCYRPDAGAAAPCLRTPQELIERALSNEISAAEQPRLVEAVLRSIQPEDVPAVAGLLAARWQQLGRGAEDFLALCRRMFDEVALSPYTGFVDCTLNLLQCLTELRFLSVDQEIDFLGYLLRHVARHLTAYDLITFHHQGANYPDALLLDAVLKRLLERMEQSPALFLDDATDPAAQARKRVRRRALRQAWLLRRFYEGLAVPDAPTSPGENQRILPPPHVRVPEEQILHPDKRTRRLFVVDSLQLGPRASAILEISLRELTQPPELRELGLATFLDRPLGVLKAPTEPDQTLLFSSVAFSWRIASKRLEFLAKLGVDVQEAKAALARLQVPGVELPLLRGRQQPGKVSLDDARKAAPDFVFLHTSRKSVAEFRAQFDLGPFDFLDGRVLIMRGDEESTIAIYDAEHRKRLGVQVNAAAGYASRAGVEFPRAGLTAIRAWDETGKEIRNAAGVALTVHV